MREKCQCTTQHNINKWYDHTDTGLHNIVKRKKTKIWMTTKVIMSQMCLAKPNRPRALYNKNENKYIKTETWQLTHAFTLQLNIQSDKNTKWLPCRKLQIRKLPLSKWTRRKHIKTIYKINNNFVPSNMLKLNVLGIFFLLQVICFLTPDKSNFAASTLT